MDGERLKLEFETLNNVREAVYFSKTIENVGALDICPDEKSKAAFDWRVLKWFYISFAESAISRIPH